MPLVADFLASSRILLNGLISPRRVRKLPPKEQIRPTEHQATCVTKIPSAETLYSTSNDFPVAFTTQIPRYFPAYEALPSGGVIAPVQRAFFASGPGCSRKRRPPRAGLSGPRSDPARCPPAVAAHPGSQSGPRNCAGRRNAGQGGAVSEHRWLFIVSEGTGDARGH